MGLERGETGEDIRVWTGFPAGGKTERVFFLVAIGGLGCFSYFVGRVLCLILVVVV